MEPVAFPFARTHSLHLSLRKLLFLFAVVALGLSGCTAQAFLIKTPTPTAGTPAGATPQAATHGQASVDLAQAATNRLLVIGEDDNLFTIDPDGKARLDLTTDADATHIYAQPTWSPTGERIGWAQVNSAQDEVTSTLITSLADGTAQTHTAVPFPPFYLNWRPDGKQLAYLGNWVAGGEQTIALRLVDIATGGTLSSTVGLGQPFYFSWSPDGKQMLAHVNNEHTALLTLDGKETMLAAQSTNFATPQWALAGDRLLYALEKDGRPQLVIADTAGAIQKEVTFVKAATTLNFSLNPKGNLLAYTETDEQIGLNSLGPLFLFDVASEQFQQISVDPVVAFFWSPDGHALLFMTAEIEARQLWLRLQVWDGKATRSLSRFIPTAIFAQQYLPFADQYAQSMQVWSPDSSHIVFAGLNEEGDAGIWVQAIDGKQGAQHVANGVFATWSPR